MYRRTVRKMQLLFVLILLAGATGLAAQIGAPNWGTHLRLHANDYTYVRSLPHERATRDATGFKYVFVNARGAISNTKGTFGTQVEVAGSPQTSHRGLQTAASVVAKMTQSMPLSVFTRLAKMGSVGVFTAAEKLTVYPEYAYLASGSCGTSCAGTCSSSCTFDGRKYEDVAGVGGARAVVVEDNLLCTNVDPYWKSQNILTHEFAHTIHSQALPFDVKQQITRAYQNAKSKSIWETTSYALSNDAEYFAEAVTAFLYVSQNNDSSGGMVNCNGRLCPSLEATREQIRRKDPTLYNILSFVLTDNRPHLDSALTVCPRASDLI